MTLSEELTARGFIYQFSAPTSAEILDGEKRTIYHGIDPSADSAHAGNFVVWMLLRHLAQSGHKVIFLVGGGTGMIGDPKPDSERELKPEAEIDQNVAKLKTQAERFIADGSVNIQFVNNKDWLGSETLIGFLRDIGKHFTVNELIKKDAIARRLASDTGLSYTEFAYPLLQGYDYLVLNRRFGCDVQVGGSDQWGNIVSGVDLIRRKEKRTAYAITVPLIIDKATGKKFGKSEGNAVWLDPEKTSPYEFYQFWLGASDESVGDYLRLFTFLTLEDISLIEAEHRAEPAKRLAQKRLAAAATTLVHGEVVVKSVERVTEALFGTTVTFAEISLDLQNSGVVIHPVAAGVLVLEVLLATNLVESKREARTFIESGAIMIDSSVVTSVDDVINRDPNSTAGIYILKRGKKMRVFIKVS